jgi:hypothetical protein
MRTRLRPLVNWVAIYAVALHAVLLGIAPLISGSSVAGDPFSIICHSDFAARRPYIRSQACPRSCANRLTRGRPRVALTHSRLDEIGATHMFNHLLYAFRSPALALLALAAICAGPASAQQGPKSAISYSTMLGPARRQEAPRSAAAISPSKIKAQLWTSL